jgi:catechol 2,3-dioxygenase-like lactoylglutathione lyase family enzyme
MLAQCLAVSTLLVTDIDVGRRFYQEQLGLTLLEETPGGIRFGAGGGSQLTIRRGQPAASGNTVMHFEVADIESEVRDLRSRGVTFEEYDTPKTVDFIAQVGQARGAWFKDPAGNVLGLREGPVPSTA